MCEGHSDHLNASNVTMRSLILGVNGHRERFDCREIQPIDFCHVVIRILNPPHRGLERDIQNEQKWNDDANKPQVNVPRVYDEQQCYGRR